MKSNFKSDFDEITEMTNKLRSRTLKESIDFADNYGEDSDFPEEGAYDEGAAPSEHMAPETGAQDGAEDAIAQIRELCLKGMVVRAKNNMDPVYQKLRQILQYCDKADKTEEENK